MYAQIGDIVLSNRYGFTGFSDSYGVAVTEHALINSKPRIATTGDELIKLKFQITLHRSYVVPEDEKARFLKYVTEKTVVPITLGTGEFLGYFLLTNLEHSVQQTLGDGTIFESTIDISALEFVGDVTNSAAKATANANPPRFQSIVVTSPISGQIVTDVVDVSAMAAVMDKDLAEANARPETRAQKLKKVLLNIQNVEKKLQNVNTLTSNVFRLAAEAENLKKKSERTAKDLERLKSAVQIKDMDSAMGANRDFQANVRNVSGATSPFTKQYALRRSV